MILHERHARTLRLLNRGLSNSAIAERLGVKRETVEAYVSRLYRLFKATSRYELAVAARGAGLVDVPQRGGIKPPPRIRLSPTEKRVLQLARERLTPAQIARTLRIPLATAQGSLSISKRKLGVGTTLEALDAAVDAGLIPGPRPTMLRSMITAREYQILQGLDSGYSTREIGRKLRISKANVGNRLTILRAKFRATSNEALLRQAAEAGILSSPLSRTTSRRVVERIRSRPMKWKLTERRREVLAAFARFPNATHSQLAARLGVSKAAIDQYSVEFQRHFAVRSVRAVVELARQRKLL